MKFFNAGDGLEGYVILVEQEDLKQPLDLPELKGPWENINGEGVIKRGGLYHAIYLTNNEFALEFLIPDADWLGDSLWMALDAHAG